MRAGLRPALAVGCLLGLATAGRAQESRSRLLTRIDSVVTAEMVRTATPGISVAVEWRGELLMAKGYGLANAELVVPAGVQTVYRIASITKQFTALAVMQLVEAGKIGLTDPITKFFPDYPTHGLSVTIEHLLNHTSGIRSYTSLGAKFWTEAVRRDLTNEQMLALFVDEPFDFNPGEQYRYNNGGYFILGVIIEKVSGLSYREYLAKRIFEPLGMSSTSYCDDRGIVAGRASGYEVTDGRLSNALPISTTVLGGAGSLCSTVLDLIRWQMAFDRAALISPSSRDRMRTSATLTNGRPTNYGFGLGTGQLEGHRMVAHGGGVFGFISWLGDYPDDGLTVTVLTNQGAGPAKQIGRLISRLVLGLSFPSVADLPVSPALRAAAVGSFGAGDDRVAIADLGGQLWLRSDGAPPARLYHQGNNEFRTREDLETVLRVEAGDRPALSVTSSGSTSRLEKSHPD